MQDFDLKDKIPTVKDLVDNGKKAAETYERNPTGSFVWIILVLCIGTSMFFGYMYFRAQDQLNEMAQTAFNQALKINTQNQLIDVQKTVIQETKAYVQDSIQPVNIKNYEGPLKIKQNEYTN